MERMSVWKGTSREETRFPQLGGNIEVDVTIVGGGITGMRPCCLRSAYMAATFDATTRASAMAMPTASLMADLRWHESGDWQALFSIWTPSLFAISLQAASPEYYPCYFTFVFIGLARFPNRESLPTLEKSQR